MGLADNKGTRALAAFVLFVCVAFVSDQAVSAQDKADRNPIQDDADFAIYIAKIAEQEYLGSIDIGCPEDSYCLPVGEYRITLDPIEIIVGNPDIGTQNFHIGQHTAYRADLIMIVYAARDEKGNWRLIDRGSVAVRGCLSDDSSSAAEIVNDCDSDWFADNIPQGQDLQSQWCFERLARPDEVGK